MSLASKDPAVPQFFLPEYCVDKQKSSSTKLGVVFYGLAITTSGSSENDLLLKGPTNNFQDR